MSGNTVVFLAERDSVSMGDDCMAPHARELEVRKDARLSEFLRQVADYVPPMRDLTWEVRCGDDVIGRLVSHEDAKYDVELARAECGVLELPECAVYCRQKRPKAPLKYFDKLMLVFKGRIYSMQADHEFDDVGEIVRQGGCRIYEFDKLVAKMNGFTKKGGYLQRFVSLDELDGIYLEQIPNDLDAPVLRTDVRKEDALAWLTRYAAEKRAAADNI